MFISQEWSKRADKASLLTASRKLLHAFPPMSVSSLREFLENCLQTRRIKLFYKIFAQKIINYQFLSYDIESA
jgi:hypothetical protein